MAAAPIPVPVDAKTSAAQPKVPPAVDRQHDFRGGRSVLFRGAAVAGAGADGVEHRAGHDQHGGGDSARRFDVAGRSGDGSGVAAADHDADGVGADSAGGRCGGAAVGAWAALVAAVCAGAVFWDCGCVRCAGGADVYAVAGGGGSVAGRAVGISVDEPDHDAGGAGAGGAVHQGVWDGVGAFYRRSEFSVYFGRAVEAAGSAAARSDSARRGGTCCSRLRTGCAM